MGDQSENDVFFERVHQRMIEITTENYTRMRTLWSEMFEDDVCYDYTKRLPEHLQSFFDEVFDESNHRKQRIQQEIEQLREEAQNLQRLLGEEENVSFLPVEAERMPLLKLKFMLDSNLEHMRAQLSQRHEIIDQYILEAETLCEELGDSPRALSKDPMPGQSELFAFRSYLDGLMAEKLQRLEEIDWLRRETKKLMGHLETLPNSDEQQQLLNARNFPPTRHNIAQLRLLHEDTAAQYASLRQHIDETRGKLERLWQCLETSASTVKKFQKLTSYTQTTFDKLFSELDRCETLRRENLKSFINRTRAELVEWWDRCLKSEEQRVGFSPFRSEMVTEEVLELHELEVSDLKKFYHENEPLFQMVAQWQEMWDRMKALENKSNDPTRYNNRGGKLLEEEKERRRISNSLPRIEAKLLEACRQFEEKSEGAKFTVLGRSVDELIEERWRQREQSKQMISSARKQANGLLGISSVGRTPGRGESTIKASSTMLGGNRTRLLGGGGGSALKPMTPLHGVGAGATSASKPPASWMKRKLTTPMNSMHAKRSLLRELNSPAQSANRTRTKVAAGKIPAMKVYDSKAGGSVATKRRSRRKSQNNRSRRSASIAKAPSVIVSSADGTVLQESVCYEQMKDFLAQNVPNRSSVVPEKAAHGTRMTRSQRHLLEVRDPIDSCTEEGDENIEPPNAAVPSAVPLAGTPRKVSVAAHANGMMQSKFSHVVPVASSTMLLRSPGFGTSHSTSIASTTRTGQVRLKPAKECPIIF